MVKVERPERQERRRTRRESLVSSRMVCKYNPTLKNRKTLKRWKQGKSIGFTARSSLKAKGLIPRTSRKNYGKKIISPKYCS